MIKNHMAERIVRLDLDIRTGERALNEGQPRIAEKFARRALDRLRSQRIHWADAAYAAYGFERAAEMIAEVRAELDPEHATT